MRSDVNFNKLFVETEMLRSGIYIQATASTPARTTGHQDTLEKVIATVPQVEFSRRVLRKSLLWDCYTQPVFQRYVYIGQEKVLTSKDGAAAAELIIDIASAMASYPELCAESL